MSRGGDLRVLVDVRERVRDGLIGVHGFSPRTQIAKACVAENAGEAPGRLATQLGENSDAGRNFDMHRSL